MSVSIIINFTHLLKKSYMYFSALGLIARAAAFGEGTAPNQSFLNFN